MSPIDALELPYARTALIEVALLAVSGGLLGTWIVLRRLAFFTHAVGAAAFPALVVAGPIGVSPPVAGIAAGLGFAAGMERTGRSDRDRGPAVSLLLVACLAAGVILASDVLEPTTSVDQLLFGSLLGLGASDLVLSASLAALAVAGTLCLGRGWLAAGFDEGATRRPGPHRLADALLLALIAVAAAAAIPAVGALLLTSLFIVPAATARLLTTSVRSLLLAAVAVAAAEGLAGLYLAFVLDTPPGPTIATLGAALYGAAAVGGALVRRRTAGTSAP